MKGEKSTTDLLPVYHDILDDLMVSIMGALQEVLLECSTNDQLQEFRHGRINRHFSWLARVYPAGKNRHLVESEDRHSLRTRPIRLNKLDEKSRKLLDDRKSLSYSSRADKESEEGDDEGHPIQYHPTRISDLIKQACACTIGWAESAQSSTRKRSRAREKSEEKVLISPLSIAFDFLTSPELPGSRAYALLAIRSYLFDHFDCYPDGIVDHVKLHTFSTSEIDTALSHVRTSVRIRHWSRGRDPLPARCRPHDIDGLLRQFLASRGILWFRFKVRVHFVAYLENGKWFDPDADFELVQSVYLDHLPDLGEIVNQLWGVPIPIRGADTIFRGGLKFSMRKGLVVAVHGGPGTGKTSLALALGAYLAPFKVDTLFLTAEESEDDLLARVEGIVPEEYRRFSFFPKETKAPKGWLTIQPYKLQQADLSTMRRTLWDALDQLKVNLEKQPENGAGAPKPCRAIVVLDGLHDLFASYGANGPLLEKMTTGQASEFRDFIEKCRALRALVVLTTSDEWAGDTALEYLVDVAVQLTQSASSVNRSDNDMLAKPNRYLILNKARHQLCATGAHGIQIAGLKGLRFSPQINYQLDKRAIWKTRLPETRRIKTVLRRTADYLTRVRASGPGQKRPDASVFFENSYSVDLYEGSNIFINGLGSGGKAALALKIACAPTFSLDESGEFLKRVSVQERLLVVSFLYPEEYYSDIIDNLMPIFRREYRDHDIVRPAEKVIRLYPGYYKPNDLFNRIEWSLRAAELEGAPFTSVIIDGIHNVFIQFPEIEAHRLIWPQLYALLRSRDVTIITTHATLVAPAKADDREIRIDDSRSEPLRHALVQKTDFRIEVDPITAQDLLALKVKSERATTSASYDFINDSNVFSLRILSAINQPIPNRFLLWGRDNMILYGATQSIDAMSRRYRTEATQDRLPL